jgi:ribosome-binding protein aMBF1 (putative translation factor)
VNTSAPTPTGPHDQAADLEATVREAVATNVRRARLAKGLSLRDLAELTGLS